MRQSSASASFSCNHHLRSPNEYVFTTSIPHRSFGCGWAPVIYGYLPVYLQTHQSSEPWTSAPATLPPLRSTCHVILEALCPVKYLLCLHCTPDTLPSTGEQVSALRELVLQQREKEHHTAHE